MASIYGVFPYPDGDATAVRDALFDRLEETPALVERVPGRMIACSDDTDISFGVSAPALDSGVYITPEEVPCLILRRDKTGVFSDKSDGRDRYVDFLISIYELLPQQPPFGYALDKNHSGGVIDVDEPGPITEHNLDCETFYDAAWVMFFPPCLVERYGRETLHDLPARRIDDLSDGTVVVVATGDPTNYTDYWDIGEALALPRWEDE